MSVLTIFIVLALAGTVYSLIGGLTAMSVNGEVNHRTSEQWMIRRIAFQAATVLLLLGALFVG